jgi:hypothetical protein
LNIREAVIAPRSPWQNAYAERVIASIRGIPVVNYYNDTRTHLSLRKDTPRHGPVQQPSEGGVVAIPRVGGLHHEYVRRAA